MQEFCVHYLNSCSYIYGSSCNFLRYFVFSAYGSGDYILSFNLMLASGLCQWSAIEQKQPPIPVAVPLFKESHGEIVDHMAGFQNLAFYGN